MTLPHHLWRALIVNYQNTVNKIRGKGILRPSALHNALFLLFLGGVLAYGAAFAWYLLAHFDLVHLLRDVNSDDSFYYFQIARNLAEGQFSTFDGGITRTNGYHPLWLLLITPFHWVFDKEAALFGIKAFEILLVAGGVALIAGAARLARLPWILLCAALPMLYRYPHAMFAGLEAAAGLFMLGLFFLAMLLYARDSARGKWRLAAVAFALPWVRLEYVAISLAATGALCLIEWSGRLRSVRAFNAVTPWLGACLGILVYFAYNGLVFGGIVPVSGVTKRAWSQARWESEGGYSFMQQFQDTLQIPVFDHELLVVLEVCVYLLLVWWSLRHSRDRQDGWLLAFLVGVCSLGAGHLAKFAQTVLTVHPYWGSEPGYFVPAYLLMALIVPVRCVVAMHFTRRWMGPRWPRAAHMLSVGLVIASAAFLLGRAEFTGPFRYVDERRELSYREWRLSALLNTLVTNRVLPEDSIIGAWDAGVIGYFSRFPVVNLDGLVNSYAYLRASRDEAALRSFYREFGITHFVSANPQHASQSGASMLFAGPTVRIQDKRQFRLWSAERAESLSAEMDHAISFWESLEPHFDSWADGVGLVVAGRLAQAFTQDCTSEALAAWSWAAPGGKTVVQAWTVPQNQAGWCVDALVLPHDARPPVHVKKVMADEWLASRIGDRPPHIQSRWQVYLTDDRLVYVRKPCGQDDMDARFSLHLTPIHTEDLPRERRQHGFDNLDFDFDARGVQADGTCIAEVVLPAYDLLLLRTGQYVPVEDGFHHVWEGDITFADEWLASRIGDRPPHIQSRWNVYLTDDRLIYVREPCGQDDMDAHFFLHLTPVRPWALPRERRQHGFDNLDFDFAAHGVQVNGICIVDVVLPAYDTLGLRTGQYVPVEDGFHHVWEGEITLGAQ